MQQIARRPLGMAADVAVDIEAEATRRGLLLSEANLKRKFSAVIIRWDGGRFEIRLEKTDDREGKRLALALAIAAVEYGGAGIDRYSLHGRGELSRRDLDRDPAAGAALAMLLPEEALRSVWAGCRGNTLQVSMAFQVPESAVTLRAEMIGLLARNSRPAVVAAQNARQPKAPAVAPAETPPAEALPVAIPKATARLGAVRRPPALQKGAAKWASRRATDSG